MPNITRSVPYQSTSHELHHVSTISGPILISHKTFKAIVTGRLYLEIQLRRNFRRSPSRIRQIEIASRCSSIPALSSTISWGRVTLSNVHEQSLLLSTFVYINHPLLPRKGIKKISRHGIHILRKPPSRRALQLFC